MSVNKINKKEIEEYIDEIVEIFLLTKGDRKFQKEFLKDILTPQEYADIGVRWQIVKALAKGESHRSISERLHVALATVGRGSRELLDKKGAFSELVRKMKIK